MIITLSIFLISCSGGSDKNADDKTPAIQDQSVETDTSSDQKNQAFGDADNLFDQDEAPAIQDQSVKTDTASDQKNRTSGDTDNLSDQDNAYSGDADSSHDQYDSTYSNADSSYDQYDSHYGNTDSSYDQYDSNYGSADSSYDQYDSNYGSADSSYDQYDSSYENTGSSYDQDDSSYENTGSSYAQDDSSNGNAGSLYSKYDSTNDDDNTNTTDEQDDPASEDTNTSESAESAENAGNLNYQRVYDNGIVWYGDTGTLLVQYQSSNPETTGIGFRVHFDNSSMRVNSVTSYPVDAIISTTAKSLMSDADNRDNDAATNYFLPFAWASLYGQWPQANQINLATIEFEKVNGSSANYTVNYSVISAAAGFRFIQ